MRPGPGPLRTTARNPVLDAAVASKRAADRAAVELYADALAPDADHAPRPALTTRVIYPSGEG